MTHESQKTLAAVRALALKDLEAASDEDIRAAFVAEGINPDQLATSIAQSLDEVLAASLREQAAAAKVAERKSLSDILDKELESVESIGHAASIEEKKA